MIADTTQIIRAIADLAQVVAATNEHIAALSERVAAVRKTDDCAFVHGDAAAAKFVGLQTRDAFLRLATAYGIRPVTTPGAHGGGTKLWSKEDLRNLPRRAPQRGIHPPRNPRLTSSPHTTATTKDGYRVIGRNKPTAREGGAK
jgi:hypothetical protein